MKDWKYFKQIIKYNIYIFIYNIFINKIFYVLFFYQNHLQFMAWRGHRAALARTRLSLAEHVLRALIYWRKRWRRAAGMPASRFADY